MAPLIRTQTLCKSYFSGDSENPVETKVLYDIDLEISEGEMVSIMGPSGSGKSTLMHILGFLDAPTSGKYFFDGTPMQEMGEDEQASIRATRVSFVFQQFNLLTRTSVLDNVLLPLLYHPTIKESERTALAEEAIEQVGLTHRKDFHTNQLSGGQQQRVAIARALVTKPDLIFADEPTGNLDSASGKQVMAVLQRLHREGRTVILVTHDRRVAEHAERIIHIIDGRIDEDTKDFKRITENEVKDDS